MTSNPLAYKLFQPAPPLRRVLRPHLIQRLNEGLESGAKVSLVSAPAGFGKTTCISEWASGLTMPVTWLSLEPSDDDPVRFFACLAAALHKVSPGLCQELEGLLRSGQLPPANIISASLLNGLHEHRQRLVLVLDDFQAIQDRAILQVLESLVSSPASPLHLVLVTREEPALPLARLRANNQLTEIRAADLRFDQLEAGRFLNELMDLCLTPADVAALEERTEGWIVGLQLAGLSIRGRADPSGFISRLSGSNRFILGYLTEEVLSSQAPEIQDFLLKTSLLERLCDSLCDAVTQRTGGAARLESLFAANLFLIPLDDEGRWYRYHHLFADLLLSRLRQSSPPEAEAALHRRAAAWFEPNGFVNEAIQHSLAAKDYDNAALLIEKYAFQMMTRGELSTCLRWMAALPGEATRQRPLFLMAKAWALTFAGAFVQVEPLLRQMETQIQAQPDNPAANELLGSAAAMRAFFCMLAGDYDRALELAGQAEALSPENSIGARSLLPYTIGTALRGQGHFEEAAEAYARDVQMGEAFDDLLIWATGVTEMINTRRFQGRLREAAEIGRQALQRMDQRGAAQFGSLAKVDVALCDVLREQDRLVEAHRRLDEVIARLRAWNMPTDRLFAHLTLARVQQSQGDLLGAWDSLHMAQEQKAAGPVLLNLSRSVDLCEIRLLLAAGRTVEAERLLEALNPGENRVLVLREHELNMLARLRLAQDRTDEAVKILSQLSAAPGFRSRGAIWLEVQVLHARALDGLGEREAALALLRQALAFAEPEGFVRIFADEGEAMRSLLAALPSRLAGEAGPDAQRMKTYAENLLAAFPKYLAEEGEAPSAEVTGAKTHYGNIEAHTLQRGGEAHTSQGGNEANTPQGGIEAMTERELEVLRLIAAGLKYGEIAARLFISLNTVRTYVKAIYAKLNANSRHQAVLAARENKIL